MDKNIALDFEVFIKLGEADTFLCSVNERRSQKTRLMINESTYKKLMDEFDTTQKMMLKHRMSSLVNIMDRNEITEIDRRCVIDVIDMMKKEFDVTIQEYQTTVIENNNERREDRHAVKSEDIEVGFDLDKPVKELQDEINNEIDLDDIEWSLTEKDTGFVLAYFTTDHDDKFYDMILSDCKHVKDYLDDKYDTVLYEKLKGVCEEFNDADFEDSEDVLNYIKETQQLVLDAHGLETCIKTLEYEVFVTEDKIEYRDRLNLALYASTDERFVFIGQVAFDRVDSTNSVLSNYMDYESIRMMKNLKYIRSNLDLHCSVAEICSNSLASVEEFIYNMVEGEGISVLISDPDAKGNIFFMADDCEEEEDWTESDDEREEDDYMTNGFVLVRKDTNEVVVAALAENHLDYTFHVNNMYVVTRGYELTRWEVDELTSTVQGCEGKSVYEMSEAVKNTGVFNGIELSLEALEKYDSTKSFAVDGDFIRFYAIDKASGDTIGLLVFSRLSPMFHGEGKVAVSKSIIATQNVSAHEAQIMKPIFDDYNGVMEMVNVDLNKILSSLTSLGRFDIMINIGGQYLYADEVIKYHQNSRVYKMPKEMQINLEASSFYGEKGHPKPLHAKPVKSSEQGDVKKVNKGITFKDVIGMTEVKEKLYDVIDQMNNRDKYIEWDIKPIRGILLHGPSGTGKSYISEALANEVNAKFIKKSSGDIMGKYIGESGQNIKKIFDDARRHKGNSIIFIDEIDAVASKRSGDDNNKERNATLNELLVQMSSPDNENIFMIFATNLHEILDPAFLRSGRCDFKIEVPLPDYEMRKGILESTSKKRPLSEDVDLETIARNMSGMNCADVSHLSNEAARIALKAKKNKIEHSDYDKAYEDMICGSSSKTTKLEDEEKRMTAIHEIGHYFMNHKLDLQKAKKISILPRGSALGFVLYANDEKNDKFISTAEELKGKIMTLLAGRASEELLLPHVGTGASNDLEKANSIARNIVCKYAFNGSLIVYDENDIMSRPLINEQVSSILNECYAEVKKTLSENKELIKELSDFLYNKEDVTGDELDKVISEFNEKSAVVQQ